jgi:two-component system sensor histidine kinase KdpD
VTNDPIRPGPGLQDSGRERSLSGRLWRPEAPPRSARWRYVMSITLIALITLLGLPIRQYLHPTNLVMPYLAIVVAAAIYLGRGPAILTSILSVLAFDYFFTDPFFSFAVADTEYLLTFLGLFVVGIVISGLVARIREQIESIRRREQETTALYTLSRDLAAAADLATIVHAIVINTSATFDRVAAVLLPDAADPTTLRPFAPSSEFQLDADQMTLAVWAFQHGEAAGRGAAVDATARARYLPLKSARGIIGVLGVRPLDPDQHLTADQLRLLDAFANQAALAIERARLAEAARRAELLHATEKLQTALLNSISHDLRTPLVSITGALSSLAEDRGTFDAATKQSLIEAAREDAERLNRLVGNLLDMTRIESGALKLNRQPCDVQDLIGTALEQVHARLGARPVTVAIPDDLPPAPLDFVLIVQVLVNVIDNALKYSPPGSPLEICARVAQSKVEIAVADRGSGIPREDLARVFDKFNRVQRPDNVSGSGLGLSICKGFVEAHGGRIWAQNRTGGGTVITLALPLV